MFRLGKFLMISGFLGLVGAASFGFFRFFKRIREFREFGEFKIMKKDLAREELKKMTLEQKVGQLMIVGERELSGWEMMETGRWERLVGGIVINSKFKIQNSKLLREQLLDLKEKIASQSGIVPFIAVDQEGGSVCRIDWLDCTAQNQIKDKDETFELAKKRGGELKNLGFNLVFAPVLDVSEKTSDFIFERTFRGDYEKVAELGEAMVRGFSQAKIIPCGKHFPGHGGSEVDSHLNLPIFEVEKEEFEKRIFPYKVTIREGLKVIMVGHLKYKNLSEKPASLTGKVIENVLRKDLGFEGVVITDDLLMGAVSKCQVLDEKCKEDVVANALAAIKAGVDMVLISSNQEIQEAVFEGLLEVVKKGEISEERVDQSVERIIRVKRVIGK